MSDTETLAFYDREAAAYADCAGTSEELAWADRFAARLAPGARVLDFGCGPGWAGGHLARAGFDVEGFDGSPGLADEAMRRHGFELCTECGYWLKGLPDGTERCPECGAAFSPAQ